MKCINCNSSKIRSRKNYTHGRSSKSSTSHSCMECGSNEIKAETFRRNFKRK